MVALSDLAIHHGSDASAARLRKRRASQFRLQAYGIIAILLAGLALITLMSTVIQQASRAVTESYVTVDIPLDAAEIDPDNTGDPAVIGKFNYGGLVKDVLKDAFPNATGRDERRELYDLVSSGAQFELREAVLNDPDQIGETVSIPLLASDVTDLYLKGQFGRLRPQEHSGNLSIIATAEEDVVQVLTSANDFAGALARVKTQLAGQAEFLRDSAELQERGARFFANQAEGTDDAERKRDLEVQAISRETERDRLLAEAADLDARAAQAGGREILDRGGPSVLLQVNGGWIKMTEIDATGGVGTPVRAVETGDNIPPADWSYYLHDLPEESRKVSDKQIIWIESLDRTGKIESVFNARFFSAGDSREPELAGIWGATVGSFWTMLVTFCLAFPIGVSAAIYLEEFAPKNRITDFIEVNINNLAAVPSIVFGLLGLAVFLGFFGVPRSSPLAGGIVLALMTLPTIIIASRAAIRAVPPSIRDAALGLGASRVQTSFHHVLPLAMPGILTGTIIGMAQALGETAPLIMVGMVAFIVDIPGGITESATVLPVQVFRWSDFPERAFEARTGAAICLLLVFLIVMNAIAVFLRKRFERRW
ncbi:MAG: phosphate ABC transporter permease PstA [Pseudomonadota bacterium]